MQHLIPHSMTRLAVGVVIGRGVLVLNAVHADTVFKDTEVCANVKPEAKSGLISNVMNKTGDVVMSVLGIIGLRHRFGGNTSESGLDCSGFVRYVLSDTFGFLLLRRAVEMNCVGTSADTAELCPGDLVFFNIMRHMLSHAGTYTGDNKFVHAPSTGSRIRADDMIASYWVTRYNGARRIEGNSGIVVKDGIDNFVEQLKRVDPNAAGKPLAMYGG